MPETDGKFFLVAPGCVQWLVRPDGTLLIPMLPERGAMLGNLGATAITPQESWGTDAEYIMSDKPNPKGADGTVWAGRIKWSKPNRTAMSPSTQ